MQATDFTLSYLDVGTFQPPTKHLTLISYGWLPLVALHGNA
jgi:hypothetical protein